MVLFSEALFHRLPMLPSLGLPPTTLNLALIYSLLCFLKSFLFFYAKRFTSRLVIAPASRRRSCLSYLHSLYRSFFFPPLHLRMQKEPSVASDWASILSCAFSHLVRDGLWGHQSTCAFHPFYLNDFHLAFVSLLFFFHLTPISLFFFFVLQPDFFI